MRGFCSGFDPLRVELTEKQPPNFDNEALTRAGDRVCVQRDRVTPLLIQTDKETA
jgi:hypothetical protein